MQISDTGWEELKEDSLDSAAPDDDNDNGHVADRDEDFGQALMIGYRVGVYAGSDIDARALLEEIEPAANAKQASEMVCKASRAVSESEGSRGGLVSRAAIAQPYEVSRHPTLHKRVFLVADKIDYVREGLHLVNLDWDGETDGKREQELKKTGQTASLECISVGTHAGIAGDWAVVFVFSRIAAKGDLAKWRPQHISVGTYSLPYLDCDVNVQSAIDPRWDRKRSDQDQVNFTGSIEGTAELDTFQVYRKLFQAHLRFCKRYRFATNLCRDHFICCDKKELEREDELMVVKVVMPAEAIFQVKESDVSDLERDRMETIRFQASEAHVLITDIVKGKKKWRGVSVET